MGAYETALRRAGFPTIAGADEAGRGACAGPLVVAACVLPPGRRGEIEGLADSKLLTPAVREQLYTQIVSRATAWSIVNEAGLCRGENSLNVSRNWVVIAVP